MPAFPLTRKAATDSIRDSQPTGVVRQTQTSVGPGKRRRRSTLGTHPMSMRFDGLTEANRVTFENWYAVSLSMGALTFTMDHPWSEDEITVRFATSNGYEWSPFGALEYSLTVNLERVV